jgi:hypothetical protein
MFPEIVWDVTLFGATRSVKSRTAEEAAKLAFGFYCKCMSISGCNRSCCQFYNAYRLAAYARDHER